MNRDEPISDQQLNAFIDAELDSNDRARILQATQNDPELAAKLAQLQQLNELLTLGYQHPPVVDEHTLPQQSRNLSRAWQAVAASLVLLVGITLGWYLHPQSSASALPLTNLSQLNPQQPGADKILIHINNMDQLKIDNALAEADRMLANAARSGKELQVEILANADGLGVFRDTSPYARRIRQLANKHSNVSFRACGFAIQHAKLKEGHNIKLLPEAQPVDAALEEIVRKLKLGWLYVRA